MLHGTPLFIPNNVQTLHNVVNSHGMKHHDHRVKADADGAE